jgi:Flp pilus assembly protein TadB
MFTGRVGIVRVVATLILLGVVALAVLGCVLAAGNSPIVYVFGAILLVLTALYLRPRSVFRRTMRAIERALQRFLAAVNRSDHGAALAQMIPAQRQETTPEQLVRQFPEYITHCEILRVQITQARSTKGQYSKLGKLLVRLDYQSGSSVDYVFLLVRADRVWMIDDWTKGDVFDLLDYTVE